MNNNVSSVTPGTSESSFEHIKRLNDNGQEYWSARELMEILEYSKWDNFKNVIEKAMEACKASKFKVSDQFPEVRNMINIGKGAQRQQTDYHLTRYACYLIVQNADPTKEPIALGQTYFATQTRRQEISDQEQEDSLRIRLRKEVVVHNKILNESARNAGVIEGRDFAFFTDSGYKGLYGGLNCKQVKMRKNIPEKKDLLDHVGSTELAANLFRATQTADKLRREGIYGKQAANKTHYDVGQKVRKTIEELGGTMPENLPSCEDIKKVERRIQKLSASCEPRQIK